MFVLQDLTFSFSFVLLSMRKVFWVVFFLPSNYRAVVSLNALPGCEHR